MFSKEYTFESRTTRLRRIQRNSLFLFVFTVFIFGLVIFYLPIYSNGKTLESMQTYYQKSPDLIVVFTGYKGRINKGMEFSKKYSDAKFLISGVYANNSFHRLINAQELQIEENLPISEQAAQLDLDYQSKNTLENVISTLQYLRSNPQLKNVLVISSDFHLLRINLIFRALMNDEDRFNIHLYGTDTNFKDWSSQKVLMKEVVKVFKTLAFLTFWVKN